MINPFEYNNYYAMIYFYNSIINYMNFPIFYIFNLIIMLIFFINKIIYIITYPFRVIIDMEINYILNKSPFND